MVMRCKTTEYPSPIAGHPARVNGTGERSDSRAAAGRGDSTGLSARSPYSGRTSKSDDAPFQIRRTGGDVTQPPLYLQLSARPQTRRTPIAAQGRSGNQPPIGTAARGRSSALSSSPALRTRYSDSAATDWRPDQRRGVVL